MDSKGKQGRLLYVLDQNKFGTILLLDIDIVLNINSFRTTS